MLCDKWCFVCAALPAPPVPTGTSELVSSFWMGQATMACSASGTWHQLFSAILCMPLSMTCQGPNMRSIYCLGLAANLKWLKAVSADLLGD